MKVWLKVVTLCFAVASSPLWAHGKMTTTVPADGSSVIEPLAQLELHFSRATKLVNVKLTSLTGKKVPVSVNRSLGATMVIFGRGWLLYRIYRSVRPVIGAVTLQTKF